MSIPEELIAKKRELRRVLRRIRTGLDQEWVVNTSRQVWQRLGGLRQYQESTTIMCYVSLPGEVQTHGLLEQMRDEGKRVVVPWCDGLDLRLFLFRSFAELEPGMLGILEPSRPLREDPQRAVEAKELDLVLVPGLGFDRTGGRLGQGKGFYDRFLSQLPPHVPKIALAFEWQILDKIPILPYDVRMDWIVTEKSIYDCSSSR